MWPTNSWPPGYSSTWSPIGSSFPLSAVQTGTAQEIGGIAQLGCPNDPAFPLQWYHGPQILGSCAAWTHETGAPSEIVALCDTGIRTTHEDLQRHRAEGYNAVDRVWESAGGDIGPRHFHGTRTTGVVAATGNNGRGGSGVRWNLGHRMMRVSNASDGGAFLSVLQHAARTAAEAGDRVINISYHGVFLTSNLASGAYIRSLGSLLFWSAGNSGANHAFSDRDADDLIVVGATTSTDGLASFSSFGRAVDFMAPGVDIYTCDSSFDQDYAAPEGTSYSSPMAAALAAMIWSYRPWLTPSDVEAILKASCVDLGAAGPDDVFGHGRIDMRAALELDGVAAPTAAFAAAVTTGRSPLTAQFFDLGTGVPTARLWDFGDGTTSTDQNPSHTYAASGFYTVSLNVSNALGSDLATEIDYIVVDLIPPVADFMVSVDHGLSPLPVQFTDTSTGGVPASWLWDFGDGTTSTHMNPQHNYVAAGVFAVSLEVTNAYGSSTRLVSPAVTVDLIPPIAAFSATPTAGNSPLVVQFMDLSSGGVTTDWFWNFGDGATSASQTPNHTYTAPGTYNVSLTVSNAYGSDSRVEVGLIQVGPGPPVLADFSGTPRVGTAPLTVQFTDLSVGNVVSWAWDFHDGAAMSTLQNPVHVFTTPGEYNITLEVRDVLDNDTNLERDAYIIVQ